MGEQLLWSFMWEPRRAVPLGGTWLHCHIFLQEKKQAEKAELAVAFAANLSNPVHY